jgi:hypothetical protein
MAWMRDKNYVCVADEAFKADGARTIFLALLLGVSGRPDPGLYCYSRQH